MNPERENEFASDVIKDEELRPPLPLIVTPLP